ncbi:MAG: molybdenum cofactor guanylyltransferase [Pseudomonadota bacterium]|nr:molybdenum cofactor guanylyltransferase [Pseudomonadota bacterium]
MTPPIDPRREVTGLVLAGGRALRMGGAAKGLAQLHGQPMIAQVIARLRPQVAGLMLNANRPDYAAFGLPLVADVVPDYAGPLAGVHAGLLACPTPWLVTVPCDAPFVPTDLVARLAAAASRHPLRRGSAAARRADSARPPCCVGASSERFLLDRPVAQLLHQSRLLLAASPHGVEPGFILAHVDLAEELGAWLAGGGRKVRVWLAAAGASEVMFADARAFTNINTPEELARLNAA